MFQYRLSKGLESIKQRYRNLRVYLVRRKKKGMRMKIEYFSKIP